MRRCLATAPILVVMILSVPALGAEGVAANTRVRITTRTEGIAIGTLLRTDPSGLTLALNGAGHKTFALDEITGFEVSRSRRSRKTKWALLGAIPWAIAVTAVLADGGTDESGIVSPQSALLLGGGVAGGLIIGSRKKSDVWEPAPIPGAMTRSSRPDVTVGLSISF